MRVGITANPNKPHALDLARRAEERLHGRVEVVLSTETAEAIRSTSEHTPLESMQADVLIAIGGDGTFLSALHRSRIPLLPVNAGTVGFLSEIDGSKLPVFDGALERLVRGLYFREDRMKLASHVDGEPLPDAANELVVHTSQVAKMRLFEIGVDGHPVGRLRADGVILATPTGSTSYSLSALGPIIDPGVEGIVVAALAPFQATQRAVVVDPLRTVSVRLVLPEKEGVVVVDGHKETRLPGGSAVLAYRSSRPAAFIRFGSHFFQHLRGKKILPWSEDGTGPEAVDPADLSPPA